MYIFFDNLKFLITFYLQHKCKFVCLIEHLNNYV